MQQSLNKFIDFFIKDKSLLSPDSLYQARTILWMTVITFYCSIIMVFLQLFGYYSKEAVLPLAFFCAIIILLMKFLGELKLVSYFFLSGGIIIIILNINETGQIYSYNQKWWVVVLLLTSFSSPRLTFPVLGTACLFQFYSYSSTHHEVQGIFSKEEYLFENLGFLVMSYLGLVVFKKLNAIQKSKIDKQNNQLVKQQIKLIENNKLLQQRSEQLLESNQELERFAYIASHDLKTPLNNIISFSILLEKELQHINNKNVHQYFKFMKDGSLKMNSLIIDVLEYSKATSKNVAIEDIDLSQLIISVNQSISEYIDERNAKVVLLRPLPIIRANRTKMYVLFKNLIENGIKYNESEIPLVEIDYNYGENHVDVKVQDNGIGIPERYHQNIFEIFSRLHRDNEYEGTGLGLALCKKIVNRLSGKISIQSQPDKGTLLIISLNKKLFPDLVR